MQLLQTMQRFARQGRQSRLFTLDLKIGCMVASGKTPEQNVKGGEAASVLPFTFCEGVCRLKSPEALLIPPRSPSAAQTADKNQNYLLFRKLHKICSFVLIATGVLLNAKCRNYTITYILCNFSMV